MADISTNYMGMRLQSPVIAASCTLTKDIENIRKICDAGAGAVVLKSLFEEEIRNEYIMDDSQFQHTEAYDYINADAAMVYGSGDYLEYVRQAATVSTIPVIASINCLGGGWWADFAANIEEAGADALELNISFIPFCPEVAGVDAEAKYIDVVRSVKAKVGIPVSVKLGQHFSSVTNMAQKLYDAGADSVTLFNRYYQMKINTRTLDFEPVHHYSDPGEAYNVLRWVAAVYSGCGADISAGTGVYGEDMLVQYILAGAVTVQTASLLYKNGFSAISDLNKGLEKWMDFKNISKIEDMRGLAVRRGSKEYQAFERLQYIKVADGFLLQ